MCIRSVLFARAFAKFGAIRAPQTSQGLPFGTKFAEIKTREMLPLLQNV